MLGCASLLLAIASTDLQMSGYAVLLPPRGPQICNPAARPVLKLPFCVTSGTVAAAAVDREQGLQDS